MVRFTIFGVPVEIQPWFWLTAAILSRGIFALIDDDTIIDLRDRTQKLIRASGDVL
jgi:hypothetical protein